MKKYGKVMEYNGVYGNIKGIDGVSYKLLDKNIVDTDLKVNDDVQFENEFYKTSEVEINIARFVKVLKKDK